jgi:hypothetical protein
MNRQLPQKCILLIITPVMLILVISACQPVPLAPADLPTLAQLPSLAPSNTAHSAAAQTPEFSNTPALSAGFTPSETITVTPTLTDTATITPTATPNQILVTVPGPPTLTPTLLPEAFVFGTSVEGRELAAYRFGTGSKLIVLVGGVHTGFEANTVGLLRQLRDHYTAHPDEVLPGIGLILIPTLNVDGLQYGEQLRGRFNGNEVDLNRNWGCDWSEQAVFRDMAVSPGANPFSEPETLALGGFIQQTNPAAVLFFHGAANGVFPGNCGGTLSGDLAQVYSGASGYPYQAGGGDGDGTPGSRLGYAVTGSAPNWTDSLGIPSADIELASADDIEFVRNRNGIRALQVWVLTLP